ncbi:hypothetical protein FB645_001712 [Coemansia sp. IMI 203386]|nr:hypothetical protein FB645_001712 [Coemansia sp. IMI 203386]
MIASEIVSERLDTAAFSTKQRASSAPPSLSPYGSPLGLLSTMMTAAMAMVGGTVAGKRLSAWMTEPTRDKCPAYTSTMTRFMWASLWNTCSWITRGVFRQQPLTTEATTNDAQQLHPPSYSSRFKYGFLQGTFGLPYGGYLVHPPHQLQSTLKLTDAVNMFSVIGTQKEIIDYLKTMRTMVFTNMSARTYTSDIVVEVYRTTTEASFLKRWLDFSPERQLVIRAGRTFIPSDFKPIVRIQAPQGLMMCEIASILEKPIKGSTINLTRDKDLNIRVMGRSRSASLLDLDDHTKYHLDDLDSLPPYQRQSKDGLPPAYSK